MKKTYFLMLMALVFFLYGCREELDYVNNENSFQNSNNFTKDNVVTKKLFKQDYQSKSFLKQNVEAVNSFLKQKGPSSSATLSKNSTIEGLEVYTDVFEEVDYLNAKYYSFHIAGSSSKEFEQKLVLKYVNDEIKDRYILRYKRLSDLKIDPSSYQLEKLISSSNGNGNSLLMYIDSYTLGCTTYTVTTFNCGHQGNHSNGEYCSVDNIYIPHDIISAQYNPNCNTEGGGSPSGSTTGDSGSQGSQNTNGDNSPTFLSIYSSAPYYEIEFVPHTNKLLNYLNLTPSEITQINANNNLRLQIYLYLQNLGLYPFTPYLGDEYAEVSTFTKFTLQFFAQNPDTTWEQFQNWFIDDVIDIGLQNEMLEDWSDPTRVKPTIKFKKHAKLNGIYNKIKTVSNFNQILKNFTPEGSVAHLIFDIGTTDSSQSQAETSEPQNYWMTIKFNQNKDWANIPKVVIAGTFMHELIHAEILRQLLAVANTNGSINEATLLDYAKNHKHKELFNAFVKYKTNDANFQHQYMAEKYVTTIVDFLKQVYGTQYTDVEYKNIAWMSSLKDTKAWNLLPQSEKDLYINTFNTNYWLWEL